MKSPRVANIVLNNFTGDNRVYKTAHTLKEAGFDVQIVGLLKGKVSEHDDADGIPVHRVRIRSMALPEGVLFGAIKYLEIIVRMVLKYRKADIWHCNDFEIFFMGVIAKLTRPRLTLIYDSHEYQAERFGKHPIERGFIRLMERTFLRWSTAFITVSKGIAEEYQRLYRVPNPVIVYNAPHAVDVEPNDILRSTFDLPPEATLFLYQGGLAVSRGIELLLDTFEALEGTDLHLVLMGSGTHQGLCEEASQRCSQVHHHPPVPYADLLRYTASADVGIISTQNLCLNNWFCMPNKLFEYIQAGIPVLCNNLHDCEIIIEDYGIGRIIPEYTKEHLTAQLIAMHTEDRARYIPGLKKAQSAFHWDREAEKLRTIYGPLTSI